MFESDKKKFTKDSFTEILKEESYDKKNKLNRSEKVINFDCIQNAIDKGISINSETLDSLDVPIFKYRTQITVHGKLKGKDKQVIEDFYGYVGSYKSLCINKNGSLGIKYNCIDKSKRDYIYGQCELNRNRNSTVDYFYRNYRCETREEALKEGNRLKKLLPLIDKSLYVGQSHLYVATHPYYGWFVVYELIIKSIPRKNCNTLIEQINGIFYKQ